MGDQIDFAEFIIRLPVWLLIHRPTFATHGIPSGVAKIDSARGPVLLFFTDKDLGERFIADSDSDGRGLHLIREWAELDSLLEDMKKRGVGHVGFDAPGLNQSAGAATFPIDIVIGIVKKASTPST